MVDVTEDFLVKAKTYLGEEGKRVRNYFCCGLQDFSPEPDSYDVIWIQWVIGEPSAAPLPSTHLLLHRRGPWGFSSPPWARQDCGRHSLEVRFLCFVGTCGRTRLGGRFLLKNRK